MAANKQGDTRKRYESTQFQQGYRPSIWESPIIPIVAIIFILILVGMILLH